MKIKENTLMTLLIIYGLTLPIFGTIYYVHKTNFVFESPKDYTTLVMENITIGNKTFTGTELSNILLIRNTKNNKNGTIQIRTNTNNIILVLINKTNNEILDFGKTLNLTINQQLLKTNKYLKINTNKYKLYLIRIGNKKQSIELTLYYANKLNDKVVLHLR